MRSMRGSAARVASIALVVASSACATTEDPPDRTDETAGAGAVGSITEAIQQSCGGLSHVFLPRRRRPDERPRRPRDVGLRREPGGDSPLPRLLPARSRQSVLRLAHRVRRVRPQHRTRDHGGAHLHHAEPYPGPAPPVRDRGRAVPSKSTRARCGRPTRTRSTWSTFRPASPSSSGSRSRATPGAPSMRTTPRSRTMGMSATPSFPITAPRRWAMSASAPAPTSPSSPRSRPASW